MLGGNEGRASGQSIQFRNSSLGHVIKMEGPDPGASKAPPSRPRQWESEPQKGGQLQPAGTPSAGGAGCAWRSFAEDRSRANTTYFSRPGVKGRCPTEVTLLAVAAPQVVSWVPVVPCSTSKPNGAARERALPKQGVGCASPDSGNQPHPHLSCTEVAPELAPLLHWSLASHSPSSHATKASLSCPPRPAEIRAAPDFWL